MKHYHEADSVKLVFSGTNYFEVLEKLIDESRHSLHIQTYIFETDETGMRIVEAIRRAAKRKVNIHILLDAYASRSFSKEVIKDLKALGVNFRFFSPLFSSEAIRFSRRLHHKIVVADKRTGLAGGINIADKYKGNGETAWLDYAILTKGAVCEYLHWLCESFYKKRSPVPLKLWDKHNYRSKIAKGPMIRYRRNDWIKQKNEIHKSYSEAFISAEQCITMVASYFLPGRTFRNLLKDAVARGVEVRIILAGRSDSLIIRLAENYLYDFYLKNGVRIFEWRESVMHGKAMVVDYKWATIGSYNLNFLSHYVSIELNTDVDDPAFVSHFTKHLTEIITTRCTAIEYKPTSYNPFTKFKTWVAYNFYRLLMNLVIYRKPKKRNTN